MKKNNQKEEKTVEKTKKKNKKILQFGLYDGIIAPG